MCIKKPTKTTTHITPMNIYTPTKDLYLKHLYYAHSCSSSSFLHISEPCFYTQVEVIEVILHVFCHHEHLFFITQEEIVMNQSVAQEGDKVKKRAVIFFHLLMITILLTVSISLLTSGK